MAHEKQTPIQTEKEGSLTPLEIEGRVKRLTSLAEDLFRRGSCEAAFESLMKAYFLDPASPHLAECERHLLPALEVMRRRGTLYQTDQTGSAENVQLASLLAKRMDDVLRDPLDPQLAPKKGPLPDQGEQARINALKQKHELAKKEREQQVWRNASRPPKIVAPTGRPSPGLRAQAAPGNQQNPPGRIKGGPSA